MAFYLHFVSDKALEFIAEKALIFRKALHTRWTLLSNTFAINSLWYRGRRRVKIPSSMSKIQNFVSTHF